MDELELAFGNDAASVRKQALGGAAKAAVTREKKEVVAPAPKAQSVCQKMSQLYTQNIAIEVKRTIQRRGY